MNISYRDNTEASVDGNIFAAVESGAENQTGLKLAEMERSISVSPESHRVMTRTVMRSDLHSDVQSAAEMTAACNTKASTLSMASTPATCSEH